MAQAALRVVAKEQNNDRKRALEAALSQIDRAFGKGSVMKLGSRDLGLATDAVSTGSLCLSSVVNLVLHSVRMYPSTVPQPIAGSRHPHV